MLSISRFVRLYVCSLLRYRLNVFLPPLPEVGCPIFLEIRNPWGKVMERSGLTFEPFCLKFDKNRRAKKSVFFANFAGLFQWGGYITTWGGYIEIWGGYKTTWGGYIEIWGGYITTWGGYIEIWGGYIWWRFWGILGPPSYGIGATIRIGREMLCLPYAGFLYTET